MADNLGSLIQFGFTNDARHRLIPQLFSWESVGDLDELEAVELFTSRY